MLDEVIRGATIVDGTGAPATTGDVGIRDGRIVAVGEVTEDATTTTDATGMVVAPGFIDAHTHYDAQLFWDPLATPSAQHGVTTVFGGNCGFTIAPVRPGDADYLRRMLAKVEGMSLTALEEGVPWDWETYGEWISRLEGRTAVNAAFLVGHAAIRRYIMGEDGRREATPDEVDAMCAVLRESIAAGGMGFSTSLSFTHSDGDGVPVLSRFASRDEVLALCRVVSEFEGTSLEVIIDGCLNGFTDDDIEFLAQMSVVGQRPVNWNVLTIDSARPADHLRQLEPGTRAAELGGKVVALTMPTLVGMTMSLLTHCGLFLLPGWSHILTLPVPERMGMLRQPGVRFLMRKLAEAEAGSLSRLTHWDRYEIGDTYSDVNHGLKGRVVGDIAAERGEEPFDVLVDIALADDLRTILWPLPPDDDAKSWELRRQAWDDPRAMLGGSDAGAHLDRMMGADFPTRFIGDCLRGRKLVPMERAVQMMTTEPAGLFGLRDRGVITEGSRADLVVFDPERVGATAPTLVYDLPGGAARLHADSTGIRRVYVNGTTVVIDGTPTGATPGTILHPGRDTATPSLT